MENICLVAIDENNGSRRALGHAIERAKISGAKLVLAHIIDWSPYSFHTPDELAERHKRREDEISRANEAIVQPIVPEVEKAGIKVDTVVRHGKGAETLTDIANEIGAAQIIIGRSGVSDLKTKVFGTTCSKLVQISDVPVLVVP